MATSKYSNSTITVDNQRPAGPRLRAATQTGQTLTHDHAEAVRIAEILKALAHPIRLRIIAVLCLCEREYVNRIAEQLDVKQAIVSQQLGILRNRGLVETCRDNGFAYYRLAEPRIKEMVRCMEGCSITDPARAPR